MMVKTLKKGLVFILLFCTLQACAAVQDKQQGLLWEITSPNMSHPAYLFGTIHSEDTRVLALPEKITQAFESSSLLMMEIELTPAETQKATMRMLLPQGEGLDTLLDKSLYRQVVKILSEEHGVPEAATNRLKPWAITTILSMPRPESGRFLDVVLYEQARKQGKAVTGLETSDEQLDAFDGMSMKDQVTLLRQALKEYKSVPQQTEELINAWLARDLDKLQQLGDESNEGLPKDVQEKLQRRLVDDRNQRMVKRMVPQLQKGNVFVAIGALHLPGDKGVIALLRQRGYTVRAIY